MDEQLLLTAGLVFVALSFDYINGFHDAANSIATVVSTRVLSPRPSSRLGSILQFRRSVRIRDGSREDDRERHGGYSDCDGVGHLRRPCRCHRLGSRDVVRGLPPVRRMH